MEPLQELTLICIVLLLWLRGTLQHSYISELQCVLSFSKGQLLESALYTFPHMLEWFWEDGTHLYLQGEERVRRVKLQ